MITQDQWDKLKQHEAYGIYLDLLKKIEAVQEELSKYSFKTDNMEYDLREQDKLLYKIRQFLEKKLEVSF